MNALYLQDCWLVDGERKTSVSIEFICVHVVLTTPCKLNHAVVAQFNSVKPFDSSEMAKNQIKISHVLYTVSLRFAGRKRTVYSKRLTLYYSNTVATQRLILSGDIATNPWPCVKNGGSEPQVSNSKRTKPSKCPSCQKTVQSNHKRYLCSVCFDMFHEKCTGISIHQLNGISFSQLC